MRPVFPVTALDTERVLFTSVGLVRKGYAEGEVDEFLDIVSATLEAHSNLLADLKKHSPVLYKTLTDQHFGNSDLVSAGN